MNGQPLNFAVKAGESRLQDKIIERFVRSGMFSAVSVSNPNSDLSVTVEMKDDGSGSLVMAFITGLTFFIVPSSATDCYKVTAKVRNNKSGVEKTFEVEDFVTTWQEILLLPFLPFNFAPVVANDVLNNVMDTVAVKVHDAACIEMSKATVPPSVTVPVKGSDVSETTKNVDVSKRLGILKEACEAGLITQAEYDQKKTQLETERRDEVEVLKKLKILKEAFDSGLVNQTEYEHKKADLMKGL